MNPVELRLWPVTAQAYRRYCSDLPGLLRRGFQEQRKPRLLRASEGNPADCGAPTIRPDDSVLFRKEGVVCQSAHPLSPCLFPKNTLKALGTSQKWRRTRRTRFSDQKSSDHTANPQNVQVHTRHQNFSPNPSSQVTRTTTFEATPNQSAQYVSRVGREGMRLPSNVKLLMRKMYLGN